MDKKWRLIAVLSAFGIVVVAIILIFKYVYYNNENSYDIFKFKDFEYSYDKSLKFELIDDDTFKITGDYWYAIVTVFIDGRVYEHDNLYYEFLKENRKKISNPIIKTIGNHKVLLINNLDSKYVYCYFAGERDFVYETKLYNKKDDYDIKPLDKFIDVLSQSKYDYNLQYAYVDINSLGNETEEDIN